LNIIVKTNSAMMMPLPGRPLRDSGYAANRVSTVASTAPPTA
jgi:hypothetical protein